MVQRKYKLQRHSSSRKSDTRIHGTEIASPPSTKRGDRSTER